MAAGAQGAAEPGAPQRQRQRCQGEVNSSSLTLPRHRTDLQESGVNRPRQHWGRLTNALAVAIGAASSRVAAGARDEQTSQNSIRRFGWIYQAPARRGIDLPSLARAVWRNLFSTLNPLFELSDTKQHLLQLFVRKYWGLSFFFFLFHIQYKYKSRWFAAHKQPLLLIPAGCCRRTRSPGFDSYTPTIKSSPDRCTGEPQE